MGTGSAGLRVGIARLHHPVLALGPGRRAGIWFQGCSIHCAGCMSRDTWEPAPSDQRVSLAAVTGWVSSLPPGEIDGVTVSGGEPFDQVEPLGALVEWLRGAFAPGKVDILVYSGYRHDVLAVEHPELVSAVDALVTGPYRPQAGGVPLRWRGSANQKLVIMTELGRQRYAAHLDAPADTGLQVDVRDGAISLIGVPRPGDLARLEQGLARRGIALDDCSWSRDR